MNTQRKLARDYLENSTFTSFWDIVHEAKIGDEEQKILDLRFVHGWPIVKIAMELNYSPECVKVVIRNSYDKIARLL